MQTILTIAGHVITKNHRISLTQADRRAWKLHVRELREADRGWYMCQINTEPMLSQLAYLQVVGKYKKKTICLGKNICYVICSVELGFYTLWRIASENICVKPFLIKGRR